MLNVLKSVDIILIIVMASVDGRVDQVLKVKRELYLRENTCVVSHDLSRIWCKKPVSNWW